MEFWPIARDGTDQVPYAVPEVVRPVLDTFARMYDATAYCLPWIGYLVSEGDQLVGTCAFKGGPIDGRVEIAYFTFPGHEGKGVATRMVGRLLEIARAKDAEIVVAAQTLPQHGASTTILQKHGFAFWTALQHPEDGLVWEWRRPPAREVPDCAGRSS